MHRSTTRIRALVRALRALAAAGCCAAAAAGAAESDVHFGLTKFLALQAGFEPGQAEAIALGDQRAESGDMQFVALVFDYACLGRDAELAGEVASRSYPSATPAPADPAQRIVVAGSDAARAEIDRMGSVKPSQGGFRLYELGQALHVLQDAYFHEGVPEAASMAPWFACDPQLSWGHPRARGGPDSHAADLTHRWPADVERMARATYDALLRYPTIGTVQRRSAAWPSVRPALEGFAKAATKAEKQAWFAAHGIEQTSFLAGISLPDGARPFDQQWDGRRLPRLGTLQSRQHETDPALLDFYSRFFVEWLSTDDFDALADAHVSRAGRTDKSAAADRAELAARLRLWRLRDHGAVAELAHAKGRLTPRQLSSVAGLARAGAGLARNERNADAVFPLVTNTRVASPLLPFIVRNAPPSGDGNARAVAIAKLRHAPYDTVGVVAENVKGSWAVVAVVGVADH